MSQSKVGEEPGSQIGKRVVVQAVVQKSHWCAVSTRKAMPGEFGRHLQRQHLMKAVRLKRVVHSPVQRGIRPMEVPMIPKHRDGGEPPAGFKDPSDFRDRAVYIIDVLKHLYRSDAVKFTI